MLSDPSVWLLDEPTASMDNASEIRCIETFKSYVKPEHTFLIVTHKLELLKLCNRIVCIANHKVMLDGERDDVLRKLTSS
jgi:ATP-binding cassette subfamily C protein LapB